MRKKKAKQKRLIFMNKRFENKLKKNYRFLTN